MFIVSSRDGFRRQSSVALLIFTWANADRVSRSAGLESELIITFTQFYHLRMR